LKDTIEGKSFKMMYTVLKADLNKKTIQRLQFSEVAELRWDGASELIRVEIPEIATVIENTM